MENFESKCTKHEIYYILQSFDTELLRQIESDLTLDKDIQIQLLH